MSEDSRPTRVRHAPAVYLSEQDREALAAGKQPSWCEHADVNEDRERPDSAGLSARDREMIENVPPHW